jgi:uncharacterized protein (DUF3084 family)
MTPIELLKQELVKAEKERDLAGQEDRYARMTHFKAQGRFADAVDRVRELLEAIETLETADVDLQC